MSNQDMQLKVTLSGDGRQLSGSLKTAAGDVREFGATTNQASTQAAKSLSKARKGVESTSTQLEQMRSQATRAVGVLAGMAGVNFTVQGFTQAITEAKGLRGAMNEVATLLDDTSGLEQYRANVVQMGKDYGDTQKQANALYQIVSAGHGGMADSARILEQANLLAMGGVTDVFTATDGLTTALNAYEYSAANAEDVSDKFFIALKGGKTTIQEIASSIGQVAPLASNTGVALDQLLSASAALTTSGLSTSESMTQLKSIISGLLAPTAQARTHAAELGLEFDLAALKTKGLSGFLADLADKTNGSAESVAQLFGSVEAQAAVLSLTGAQAGKFSEILANMGDSAGATSDAVTALSQGAEFALDGIGRSLAALRLEAGESFLEALAPPLVFVNENFDDLINTTAFLTKTTVALFAAYKLGPPLMSAVTAGTTAMSAATQAYTVRTLAATAATRAARLAMLALPHVAVAAGIAAVVYAFTQYNNQQKETARLANEARASIAAYNAEQSSVEGLQARLEVEEEALAAAQAAAAAHEAGTSQAAQSLEKLRSMIDSGNFSGDTLTGLVQNYEKLQTSMESAAAKAEGSKQRIADLKEALAALGVQTADTEEKLNSLGQAGEQSDAIEKLTAALVDQYTKLTLGERAYLDYQLVQQSATAAQREQALAAYDSIEALKTQEAAQSSYASTLSKSASESVKSLADVEKQSQRVWSALAAGKISAAQAAAAIDGLASAGASLAGEQQQWIDQMVAAMDPARALRDEITTLQESFEEGLFGDLSEDKFNDYIDGLKKKLAELNGVKIEDPAVQMGNAMQTAASGIKDVAGAMQGMHEQGTRGYQEMAVAMQAANVVAAVGAVLQQGKGDPYTAFARMAAMAAAVTALGVQVSMMGSDFPDDAAKQQAQQGTGTVLGDAAAKSESIANAVEVTADATSELVGINRGMLTALQNMQLGISGASVMVAQQMSRTSFDYGGGRTDIDLSEVLAIGLVIHGGTLADMMKETQVSGYQAGIEWKSNILESEVHVGTAELSDDVALQFNRVFASLADSVYQGATALGFASDDVSDTINNFVIETQRISLKGLDAEEQTAEIEAVFSVMLDNLAESTVEFLPKFQQAGEALGETLARVATNVQVTEEAVFRLGFAAENVNPEQFATLSTYLIQAAGGLEDFISGMSGFVDKFAPESHKLELLTADMTRALSEVGLAVPATSDEMWELMQSLDATTEAGADQIATLLRLSSTADSYYKQLDEQLDEQQAAAQQAFMQAVTCQQQPNTDPPQQSKSEPLTLGSIH